MAIPLTRSLQLFQVARYAIWFALTVWLARIDPSKERISQYESLVLLATTFSFFWVSGLFDSLIPLFRKSEATLQPGLLGQALRGSMALSLLTALATFGVAQLRHPDLGVHLVLWFSLYQFFHLGSLALEHVWILRSRGGILLGTGITYYMVLALELGVPLTLGMPLETAFVWMTGFAALRFVAQAILLRREWLAPLPQGSRMLLLRAALPLSLAALLGGGATYVDSNLVRAYFSNSEFVNFTYGARELPLALLLANAISMVKSGEIAAAQSLEERTLALQSLRKAASNTLHWVFPVTLLLLCTSGWVIQRLLGEPYKGVEVIFDISLLLVIPRMIYPQAVVKAHLKGWMLTGVSLGELALNVVLSLVLLPHWGTAGIAVATVVAYAAEKIFLAIYAKVKWGIGFGSYTPILPWASYSLGLGMLFALKYLFWT
jgi:O-antigen/teichoic acid export membrane protein